MSVFSIYFIFLSIFELVLTIICSDMRQWAAVGASLPSQLSWADPRSSSTRAKLTTTSPTTIAPNTTTAGNSSIRRPSNTSSTSSNSNPAQVHYGMNDGMGPGTDGVVIPGVDMCRTLRVFTGRKAREAHPPGGDGVKILGVV